MVLFSILISGFLGWLDPPNVLTVPTRAFFLWKNRFTSITTISNRESDVEFLRGQIRHTHDRGDYLVVHGPKGIGKTCAIETAAQNMRGIIFTKFISPETSANDIVQIAYYSVTKTADNLENNALNILSWYKFLFGDTLTLVLNIKTRNKSI